MILFRMLWPFEHFGDAGTQSLEFVQRIAGDRRTQRRAADDQHFVRDRFHDRAKRPPGDGKPAKHHDQQNDNTDASVHILIFSVANRFSRCR